MSQQCNSLLNFSPNIQNLKTIGWEFNCHSNTNSLCLVSDPSHTPAHNPASNPALSCAHIAFAHPALKSPIKYFACHSMLPGKLSDNARLLPSHLATESLVILTSPVLPRKCAALSAAPMCPDTHWQALSQALVSPLSLSLLPSWLIRRCHQGGAAVTNCSDSLQRPTLTNTRTHYTLLINVVIKPCYRILWPT